MPVMIALFYHISFMSPVFNFFAISWVAITTVPLIMLAMIVQIVLLQPVAFIQPSVLSQPASFLHPLSLLQPLQKFIWQLADASLEPILYSINRCHRLLGQWLWVPVGHDWVYPACGLFALTLFFPVLYPRRKETNCRWLLASLTCLIFTPINSKLLDMHIQTSQNNRTTSDIHIKRNEQQPLDWSPWQISVLDVGHGLAILIRRNQHWILYDTGQATSRYSMAEAVISPILYSQGVHQLDGVIISHFDQDHAGGLPYIEQTFHPFWIRSSQQEPLHQACIKGQSWYWQGLKFNVLWPTHRAKRAYNRHSCVIRVSDSHFSVLLTGDIEAASEHALTQQSDSLQSDILVVPHHGSRTSSTQRFLDHVEPNIAIASLNRYNHWHFPSTIVKKRYNEKQIKWYDTDLNGEISVLFSSDHFTVETQRFNSLWYHRAFHPILGMCTK